VYALSFFQIWRCLYANLGERITKHQTQTKVGALNTGFEWETRTRGFGVIAYTKADYALVYMQTNIIICQLCYNSIQLPHHSRFSAPGNFKAVWDALLELKGFQTI
jgi:hypothetical protein